MAISHNPIFNQAMSTGVEVARVDQAAVDSEFAKITSGPKMTVEGTAGKVFGMFLVLLATAGVTWFFGLTGLMFPAMIVGLGLGLWATFGKKVRPGVVIAYAAAEGVFLGALTRIFETMYPGIAQQAVLATLCTAGAMFAAYRYGWIKVNARFTRVMTFALFGYMAFALINLAVGLFTNSSGAYGTGFGWLIALVGVGLAAFTLNLDFEAITVGAREGLPVETEWRAAFGLVSSLIWLYVEILRLLSIFNRD
ncbi:Bax inhibitor-1/YccA family protein [Rhodoluna lacicola]|uniref:Putative membrane protein n=1 Tax=Rhodoluna lacicola TaxID=529884 RepID=A0A060JLE2_9MICO|nr:Bax inhibitor-1/YccA family protein [Rhodoluna lacicola]AIC47413.1 putative membrane protein [Rhodoluna lacicola]